MTNRRGRTEPPVAAATVVEEEDKGPRPYTFRSESGNTEVRLELDKDTGGGKVSYFRDGHMVEVMVVPEEQL